VSATECPKCHLPRDDDAWQCDGCGYEFRQDFDQLRSELRAQLATSRIMFVVAVVIDVMFAVAIVWLAMLGWIYISMPLVLGALGFTGYRVHRMSVLRDRLRSLDRRHVPLPKASVQK